jgi:hypothetical protein
MEQQEGYEVAVTESKSPGQLIALALDRGADPGTLEKLMDLQERWEAGRNRQAYVTAMTGFKQEAPAVLVKGDKVDFQSAKGRTHYNYANLGSIVQEITAILGKYGLSASWETKQNERDEVIVTCHITHEAGHRESVTLRGPADDSGNKNRIQAVGSTVTYLQRYTLLAALGLATGEDDDDRGGNAAGPPTNKPPITPPQRASAAGKASTSLHQQPPASGTPSDIRSKIENALAELTGLTGAFEGDLIQFCSKFTDSKNVEHSVDNLDDLMKSEKWARSTLGRLRADIEKELAAQPPEPGSNG